MSLLNKNTWKVQMIVKKRDSSIELARFVLACLVFFTHVMAFQSMQESHYILARVFRVLGAMSTITFASLSGYFLIAKPSKGRWLKVLFSMLILLILNWLAEVIGASIRGYVWLGSSNSHRVTFSEFFSHPMGREGWLNQLIIGNDIHWYMWQFAIALVIFPILSKGLVKMSKRNYFIFVIGLLLLNVIIKMAVLAGFEENTIGGFLGLYGRSNAVSGADGAPYSGYNWMLILLMMSFAGWFKLHYKGQENKKGMLWFLVTLGIVIVSAIVWKYSNHKLSTYNNAADNGLPLDGTGKPISGTALKNWWAKQYVVTDSYGVTWIGTFLEGGNYIPVAALLGSMSMFIGIIHLPKTKIKVFQFLGAISYAYYFLHMDAMSWTSYFLEGVGFTFKDGLYQDAGSYGFMYIAFMVISWFISFFYGVAGTYVTRLAMKITNPWWEKHFNKEEKIKKQVE